MENNKYLLVESSALPEVFNKVCEAKSLLAKGIAKNASEAAKAVGISRSVFYKYKNSVFYYDKSFSDNISSLYLKLIDKAGVLSSVIGTLYENGANILTINQNIPVDSVAPVTISVKTNHQDDDGLVEMLKKIDGVVEAKLYSKV
jgi:chorismate mutase